MDKNFPKEMIGNKLLVYKANKLALKRPRRKCSISYSNAVKVGIIFSVEDIEKHNLVKAFIKKLKNDNKEVEVLAFLPKGRENYEFLFSFFTEKDISFFGKFNNKDVIRFAARSFDFLYCLDCNPHPLIESILALSKASCRIGCNQNDKSRFYELMIQPKHMTTENLINEMYRYTKLLQG